MEQHEPTKDRIRAALASSRLTDWQRGFLTDMLAKHERFGARTRLSAKQHATLHRLIGEMLPEPPEVVQFPPRQPRPRHQLQQRSKPWRPRRPFRQARKVGRQFSWIMIAAIGLFAIISSLFQQGGGTNIRPSIGQSVIATPDRLQISVIDGDTIRVAGKSQSIRLVGFNAPETGRAQCAQEQALGHQATARLKQLVANGTPSVEIVPCACKPGTHGTEDCNFGRACGVLKVDGSDVGETLIAERLAARFQCGVTNCPPLPRPWC